MRIALVRPKYDSHLITPPIGLGCISSYLKKYGYKTKIIDGLNLNLTNEQIIEKCKGYDIVGIFSMSAFFLEVIDLSKKLKCANKKVVIGGPHATCLPFLTQKKTQADFIVLGEGEQTFLELIQNLEKNKSLEKIPGLITKNTKKIIERPFIKNINSLPFPDWEQMDPRTYKKAPHGALIKNFPVAIIVTTIGCPFDCKFCASPRIWKRTIRYRSPDYVIEEMKYLINNFGVKEIHFEDDNLTLKREHVQSICKKIISNKLRISWACPNGIRADKIDLDLLKLMKESGCYYLAFGFESGNQEILNNVNKEIKLETLRNAAVLADKVGIMTQGFFIFGLPGETKETVQETIDFAKSTPLNRAQFLLLDVFPGSQLWDELDFEKNVDWTKHSYQESTWKPPTIDLVTLNSAPSRAFKSFFFRPKPMFSLIKYFRLSQLPFILKRIQDFKIMDRKSKN